MKELGDIPKSITPSWGNTSRDWTRKDILAGPK